MDLSKVSPGKDLPNDFNVIIEIPALANPVKYEVDKETGAMFVDRFMTTAMHYPCNYGYVPRTLSEDGDPCDALVLSPYPLITGVVVRCRPIGMLRMTDEKGPDAKILAVPVDKLCRDYLHLKELKDVPKSLLDTLGHFFEHYKDLESNKWVKVDKWVSVEEAKQELLAGAARYTETEAVSA